MFVVSEYSVVWNKECVGGVVLGFGVTQSLRSASVISISPGSIDIVLESATLVMAQDIFLPKNNPRSRNNNCPRPIANGSNIIPHPIRQKLMLAPIESIDRANPSSRDSVSPTTSDFTGFFLTIIKVIPIGFISKDKFLFSVGLSSERIARNIE